jgi:hypothetical protein
MAQMVLYDQTEIDPIWWFSQTLLVLALSVSPLLLLSLLLHFFHHHYGLEVA